MDAERVAAVVEFVSNGSRWESPSAIAWAICDARQWGAPWPAGSAKEFELAVASAVSKGLLQEKDGKVWLVTEPARSEKKSAETKQEAPKVVQQQLF